MLSEEEIEARDALIAAIHAAFDGVSREGGVSLHEADVIDYYGSDAERAEARLKDTEIRWQDVPEDDLNVNMGAATFLDPIGFRYYIPAFMILSLNCFRTDLLINDDVILYRFSSRSEYSKNQWSLLDQTQREAVSRYLHFFVRFDPDGEYMDTPHAQQALVKGWDRYLAHRVRAVNRSAMRLRRTRRARESR